MIPYKTIGIEVETDTITQHMAAEVQRGFPRGEFKPDRDASIESYGYRTPTGASVINRKFLGKKSSRGAAREVLGVEFVSSPMTMEVFRAAVRRLMGILRTMGEPEQSSRASIHIHIGCQPELRTLQNVLKLFAYVEPLFYRLGGMGYEFRGGKNNSIYCRPITTKCGPPVVMAENEKYYSIFNIQHLLNADDMQEFWYAMAVDTERIQRYHPSRYFGLNVFSTILHGTLEFRFFNKTLDHMKINAVASLCQCITEWAVEAREGSYEIPNKKSTDEELLDFLLKLIKDNEIFKMADIDTYTLRNIISSTPEYKVPEFFVKTHLMGKWVMSDYWLDHCERGRVGRDDVIDSGFIDIHNIERRKFDFLDVIK